MADAGRGFGRPAGRRDGTRLLAPPYLETEAQRRPQVKIILELERSGVTVEQVVIGFAGAAALMLNEAYGNNEVAAMRLPGGRSGLLSMQGKSLLPPAAYR